MARTRLVCLGAVIACTSAGWLLACAGLKSAETTAAEPLPDAADDGIGDGGTPPTADEAGDEDAPSTDAGRTCPIASDKPEALGFVTTPSTVFDSVTKLMWERTFRKTDITTFSQAKSTCSGLRTAGQDDWRVPTRSELFSILDYREDVPKIAGTIFPSTVPDLQWTSTAYDSGPNDYWIIDLFGGSSIHRRDINGLDGGALSVPLTVRCVRTVEPTCLANPRFVREGSIIRDVVSGLEWSAETGAPRGASEALAFCSGLPGRADRPWRLPSIKESDTLVTGPHPTGYLTPVLPTTTWTRFWTGTVSGGGGLESKYVLDTSKGNIAEVVFTPPPTAVRCVR